jgi:hypothetical protein
MTRKPNALLAALEAARPPVEPAPEPTPEPERQARPLPKTREGTRLIAAHVPVRVWELLSLICIEEKKTKQNILEEAIDLYLTKKGKVSV